MKINSSTEIKIVALIARGDSYRQIKESLSNEGIDVSISVISKIKDRNKEALSHISNALIKQETSAASRINHKARQLIENRLNAAEGVIDIRSEAMRALLSHEIEKDEYESIMRDTESQIALKDLTTISKEFWHQSQVESNKPTDIRSEPEQARKNVERLLLAIRDGSQEDMVKAIFLED